MLIGTVETDAREGSAALGAARELRAVGGLERAAAGEARLASLARAPTALRRALARVAGRMVATRGWERLGFARLADYAVERAGMSARELRDLAHVDRALAGLPALDAAFLSGAIGWTQLRLLCRVAQPEDQELWLARTARLTARGLAREVRAVDARAREPTSAAEPEEEARVGVVLRVSPAARGRWWSARQFASRVAGHALSHAAFAEVLGAEVLSGVPLESGAEDGAEEPVEPESGATSETELRERGRAARRRGAPAETPSEEVLELERGLDEADAFGLDRRLRCAARLEGSWQARLAPLLVEAVAGAWFRAAGYRSFDRYAEERLGMAPSRARALLRVGRIAARCPALRDAFASGRLSWVQAHALAPLLFESGAAPFREAWVDHAGRVSVRRLGDDVSRALGSRSFAPPPLDGPCASGASSDGADPAGLRTGANTRLPKETERLFFSASPEVAQLFRAVLATVQRRLERERGRPSCVSEALEAMLDHAIAAWQPEKKPPRAFAVFERDGWRCTAPGCTSHRNLHQHHVVFRSAGGSNAPENLTTLCAWHHLRGVHGGLLRCTGTAPGRLHFALGLRAGRPPLAVYGPGEVRQIEGRSADAPALIH